MNNFFKKAGRRFNISVFSSQALVDELEQRINHCHTKGMEDEEDYERAAKALGAAPGNKTKKGVATPGGKFTVYVQCLVLGM